MNEEKIKEKPELFLERKEQYFRFVYPQILSDFH